MSGLADLAIAGSAHAGNGTSDPARAWLDGLLDPGSFVEFGAHGRHRESALGMARRRPAGDGIVAGLGRLDGRPVAAYAQNPRQLGGTLGEVHGQKMARALEHALRGRMPVVGAISSGGARIQEGVGALDAYAAVFRLNAALSGRVPQISVVLGSCAGGAVYSPALTDVVIMTRDGSSMFLTGPRVVHAVTKEQVTPAELGGSQVHATRSGVVHLVADDAADAMAKARRVLSFLPGSCWEPPPPAAPEPPGVMPDVPREARKVYDVRGVIRGLADGADFLELQPRYAPNIVTGFARLAGHPVGVVANQPLRLAGVIDARAAEKGARFVRMCDAFGVPLLVLVDTPGFLPGRRQEAEGVIRRGAKLLFAFSEATVPRVTVILRKAYGGAYIVMNSRNLGADAVLAWPGAEIAVMGEESAVEVVFHRELAADPAARPQLIDRYRAAGVGGERALERMSVDREITPAGTRQELVRTFAALLPSLRPGFRHDNLPQ
ncbi:acyl-CoA carboxylase subunit beta [Nonomuraea fastidiosa]|uniref:acyl-CoA carboxylase subunit beta n=1 Tax=Nonomuraea TaxID=83681 RepID=UPI00366B8117